MNNNEKGKSKLSHYQLHKKTTKRPRKRQETTPIATGDVTLSASAIHALVDAIAEDMRFKDAFHALQNLLLIHSKQPDPVEPDTVSCEPEKNAAEEAEHSDEQLSDSDARVDELEMLINEKQSQLEQMRDYVAQLEAQTENFQKQLINRNVLINNTSKERDELEDKLKNIERNSDTMENALNGISASIIGAISHPLAELELRLATASKKTRISKLDLHAVMNAVSSLRTALENIDIGGGYSIEIGSCVDEETWLNQKPVLFDDNIHIRGESGQQVLVRSRGFTYIDSLGDEKIIKADVYPVQQPDDLSEESPTSEVNSFE